MSETAHGKYGTDNYAVIPLPSATQVGLEMTLTIIRDVAAGLAVKVEHLPPAAYIDAAEVARAYDIPLVKRAISKMAVKVFASDPYGLLAIMVACDDASVEGRKRTALASGYAFNMSVWARETLAAHAPATLLELMEMQLRHHAARETITAEIDDTISKVWYSSCSRKKCREDIGELVKTATPARSRSQSGPYRSGVWERWWARRSLPSLLWLFWNARKGCEAADTTL